MASQNVALLFSAVLLAPSFVSATCYWANSTLAPDSPYSIATDDTACFPDQDNSPCCGTGWSCLSDGVCYIEQEGNSFYYRGTCTDRTWDSQQCPGWCFAQNSNTSIPLAKCQNSNGEDWYCCPGDDECNCDTGKYAVKLGATQPTTVTVIGSTSWPGIQSTTSVFSTSAFLNTNSGSSQTSTTTASTSPSSTVTGSTSATSTAATSIAAGQASASASTSASPTPSTSPGHSNTGLAAGLGAGLGVALVAILALLAFLFMRRRRSHQPLPHSAGSPYAEMAGNNGHMPPNHYYGGASHGHPGTEMAADASHQRLEMDGAQSGTEYKPGPYPAIRHELSS